MGNLLEIILPSIHISCFSVSIHNSYLDHLWWLALQVTQLELVESQVVAMATVLASAWTPHWDLCGLSTPSMISKPADSTLVLDTEINMYIGHIQIQPYSSGHFGLVETSAMPSIFWRCQSKFCLGQISFSVTYSSFTSVECSSAREIKWTPTGKSSYLWYLEGPVVEHKVRRKRDECCWLM